MQVAQSAFGHQLTEVERWFPPPPPPRHSSCLGSQCNQQTADPQSFGKVAAAHICRTGDSSISQDGFTFTVGIFRLASET